MDACRLGNILLEYMINIWINPDKLVLTDPEDIATFVKINICISI